MAFIHKLKFLGFTIYPATVPQAVVDPADGKDVLQKLSLKATHGYVGEETVKTLKEVEGSFTENVEGNENTIAEAIASLKNEIDSLNRLLESGLFSNIQIDALDVISEIKMKGSPLIYVRNSAPNFAPDQVPQFYVDTAAGRLYTAKGTGSVNDWF
jgi:hypothetical protein